MVEITSITRWMDPVLDFFARLGGYEGVEAEIYKAETGAEWLASGIEMAIDWISKGMVNRGLKALAAIGFGITGLLKQDLHPRLRKELTEMANHLATRAVYFSPRLQLASEEDRRLVEALASGRFEEAVRLAFRTPDELVAFFKSILPPGKAREELTIEEISIQTESAPVTHSEEVTIV